METLKQKNNILIPAAIVIAAAMISTAIYFMPAGQQGPDTDGLMDAQPAAPVVNIADVKIAGEPFVGDPNAPVTVVYWSDYQCPFCKRFNEDAIAQLNKNYVTTGKVKIVFKDFQFLGPDSQTAGKIARAVWDTAPDKFFTWHKAIYQKQDAENNGWGSEADILALTNSLGIDVAKVNQLMNDNADAYQKAIDENQAEGRAFGINGTPGTIIGTHMVSGAQPYAAIKQLVDIELQKQ